MDPIWSRNYGALSRKKILDDDILTPFMGSMHENISNERAVISTPNGVHAISSVC